MDPNKSSAIDSRSSGSVPSGLTSASHFPLSKTKNGLIDEEEAWHRQRSRQHSDEMTAAVARARQRREEEEKKFEASRLAAREKARLLDEKARAEKEEKESRESSLPIDEKENRDIRSKDSRESSSANEEVENRPEEPRDDRSSHSSECWDEKSSKEALRSINEVLNASMNEASNHDIIQSQPQLQHSPQLHQQLLHEEDTRRKLGSSSINFKNSNRSVTRPYRPTNYGPPPKAAFGEVENIPKGLMDSRDNRLAAGPSSNVNQGSNLDKPNMRRHPYESESNREFERPPGQQLNAIGSERINSPRNPSMQNMISADNGHRRPSNNYGGGGDSLNVHKKRDLPPRFQKKQNSAPRPIGRSSNPPPPGPSQSSQFSMPKNKNGPNEGEDIWRAPVHQLSAEELLANSARSRHRKDKDKKYEQSRPVISEKPRKSEERIRSDKDFKEYKEYKEYKDQRENFSMGNHRARPKKPIMENSRPSKESDLKPKDRIEVVNDALRAPPEKVTNESKFSSFLFLYHFLIKFLLFSGNEVTNFGSEANEGNKKRGPVSEITQNPSAHSNRSKDDHHKNSRRPIVTYHNRSRRVPRPYGPSNYGPPTSKAAFGDVEPPKSSSESRDNRAPSKPASALSPSDNKGSSGSGGARRVMRHNWSGRRPNVPGPM